MMNERGFVSVMAIFIMMMMSMAVVGITTLANRQLEIFNFKKQEIKLTNAAESAMNEVIINLKNDDKYYGNLSSNTSSSNYKKIEFDIDGISVTVYIRRYEKTRSNIFKEESNINKKLRLNNIVIEAISEIKNYNYNVGPIFKRIYGYMQKIEVLDVDDKVIEDESEKYYEFREYLE